METFPTKADTPGSSVVKIQIGANEHLVDLEKIPYFRSFLSFQELSGQDVMSIPTHDDIAYFEIINHGVSKGFRQFFRRLPTQLSDYHVLCESLQFLVIDVLEGRKLSDIMRDLGKGKSDWDPEERREIPGMKNLARDSAFRLVYTFLISEFESEVNDSNLAYNATLFIVSHRRIFKYRTRRMVREAFEERFCVSEKQSKALDKWPINEQAFGERQEDDATTDDVEEYSYDSDWSY